MISSPMSPYASVSATLIETVLKELNLSPEQLHQKREQVTAAFDKCLSDYFSPEKGLKADPTDDDQNPNHALPDSLFMRDLATPVWEANNEYFMNTVRCCLVEAGMEEKAQDYMEMVRTATGSGVEIESMKIWSLITIHYQMLKQMDGMGFVTTSASFEPPSLEDLFPTPQPGWKANSQGNNNNPGTCLPDINQSNLVQQEAGIAAEIENTSTPVEETIPAELVHNGEVAAELMIDAEAESVNDAAAAETQKDMMEAVENLEISSDR